jgi:hypothetical protein
VHGVVVHYDGNGWTLVSEREVYSLYAVAEFNGELWVAGAGGALLRKAL